MSCVFEKCTSNQRTRAKNTKDGVQFIPFPSTDYGSDQLRRLAKKRLYWWCRVCGVDFNGTLLNQLHVCSRHFVKGAAAQLWDAYSPDWIPSLAIPPGTITRTFPSVQDFGCDEFINHERLTEESIANPVLEGVPEPAAQRTDLIDELIAYPIGRTYHLLDDESGKSSAAPYNVKYLPSTLRSCLTRTSTVGRMIFDPSAPHHPERIYSGNSNITPVDLSVEPRWETEHSIMKLQNSVLELIALMDRNDCNGMDTK